MPLLKGKKNIGRNIATEMKHGKPRRDAVAIAMRVAGAPRRHAACKIKGRSC